MINPPTRSLTFEELFRTSTQVSPESQLERAAPAPTLNKKRGSSLGILAFLAGVFIITGLCVWAIQHVSQPKEEKLQA